MPRSAAPPRPTSDIALPTTGDKTLAQIPPSPQRSTPVLPPTPSAAPSPSPSRVVQTPTPPAPAALPSPTPPGPTVGAPKVGTDTDVSAFAWYLAAVERKVRDNWRPLAAGPDRPIIVFEIGRNGRIQNLSVQKRSGNDAFDRGARDAIRNSDPFPPLPDVYKESILRVHLEFERI
jgi:TonB family protein